MVDDMHVIKNLTLSALRLASLACCSQASALSMALSFSSFIACIFFLMASIAECVWWSGGAKKEAGNRTQVTHKLENDSSFLQLGGR